MDFVFKKIFQCSACGHTDLTIRQQSAAPRDQELKFKENNNELKT